MEVVYQICYVLLALALVLTAYRLFQGPVIADRILAIDLMAVIVAGMILLGILAYGNLIFLDVVVVLGIIVFFGTVALARTLTRKP
ncbi:MAG: monovalent cation/H+ antiporter complex subunit F [Akkermansiaceae bacterium]